MYQDTNCKLQAHRGVSTDAPENTMAAYRLAKAQGYDLIELDPKFTKDGVPVLLHDPSLNRTARLNGETLSETLYAIDVPLEELKSYDVGEWFSKQFAGERIPTFAEVLAFAEEQTMELKVDNVLFSYPYSLRKTLYQMLVNSNARVGVTASTLEDLCEVAREVPTALLHYDGEVSEQILSRIREQLPTRELTVWLRFPNELSAWSKIPPVCMESAAMVKRYATLGLWIINEQRDMQEALRFSPDVVETNGGIKP